MKQGKFIEELKRAAQECGQALSIDFKRHGTRLSTPQGSIRLGPDYRQEIHENHYRRYLKALGISEPCLGLGK